MSLIHSGNKLPEIAFEEHDGTNNAKRVNVVAGGVGQVTIVPAGNVTLSPSPNFIGLVTNVPGAGTTIYPSPNYIGLVTVDIGTQNKVGITGNVTLSDPKTFIGLVTTQAADPKGFVGLVTLGGGTAWTDPKSYIGLVTNSNALAWPDPKTYIGLVTVGNQPNVSLIGNITISGAISLVSGYPVTGIVTISGAWPDPKGYIGLVTVGNTPNVAVIGNVTLSDPKTFIGLVTIGGIGTVTLADPKGFIGLVTAVPTFLSGYTSLATIISAVGVATLVIPPSGQKIFVKDIHVSSLGRSEISFWRANIATATAAVIPWTALSTTGGFVEFFGDSGSQWGLADDGLTAVINFSAATIGVMINCRFA